MQMTPTDYASTGEILRDRIVALIPTHPEILDIKSSWDLFKIKAFDCSDLQPSLFQASWALREAKRIANELKT